LGILYFGVEIPAPGEHAVSDEAALGAQHKVFLDIGRVVEPVSKDE
jgi:hypothetical protein